MWWFQRRNTSIYSKSSTSTARPWPARFQMWSSSYKARHVLTLLSYAGKFSVVTVWTGSESKNRNDQTKMDCKRQVKVLATVGIICAHLSMHIYTIIIYWILQGIIYTCECRSAPHSKYKHGSYILRIYRSKEPTVGQAQWSSFVRQTYTRTVNVRLLTFTNWSFFLILVMYRVWVNLKPPLWMQVLNVDAVCSVLEKKKKLEPY